MGIKHLKRCEIGINVLIELEALDAAFYKDLIFIWN